VAASLDLDRKQLAWQRREDWRSHPQLAHRLEANSFVTDLIAATSPIRRSASPRGSDPARRPHGWARRCAARSVPMPS
jgi:hypothetical protein